MFMSEEGRNLAASASVLLGDGTQKKAPKPFFQIYALHCQVCRLINK